MEQAEQKDRPRTPPLERRRVGRLGEDAAARFLEARGYRIIDTNVRFGRQQGVTGELDIIAWDGETLCFIEVKTRQGRLAQVAPAVAVTTAKQQQIATLATVYATVQGLLSEGSDVPMRFDVVAVTLSGPATHIELYQGAFLNEP